MASSGTKFSKSEPRLKQTTSRANGVSTGDRDSRLITGSNERQRKRVDSKMVESMQTLNLDKISDIKTQQYKLSKTRGLQSPTLAKVEDSRRLSGNSVPPNFEVPYGNELSTLYKKFSELETSMKVSQYSYSASGVGRFCDESETVLEISNHMLEISKRIGVLSPKIYIKYSLEPRVWKTVLYDNITLFRNDINKPYACNNNKPQSIVFKFIEMGCAHFKDIIKSFAGFFSIDLKPVQTKSGFLIESDSIKTNETAIDLIYKFYTNMGDLSRYGFLISSDRCFRLQSLEYYDMARLCDYKKGRAYYQSAVLSTYMGDTFGAAYNFVRALSSSVPADGARYQLGEIFYKAYQEHLGLKYQYWGMVSKCAEKPDAWSRKRRREIWILPGEEKPMREIPKALNGPPTKKEHIDSLTPPEVYDRFARTYVVLLGKLFTRVGMDCFDDIAEEALVYFEGMMEKKVKLSFNRFVQIVSLGMHIADTLTLQENAGPCEKAQFESDRSSAIGFILEMFSIASERLMKLTDLCDWNNPEMEYLSAGIMMWCLWLQKNECDWNIPHSRPKFSIRQLENRRTNNNSVRDDDVWIIFSQLVTRLNQLLFRNNLQVFPVVSHNVTEDVAIPMTVFPETLALFGLGKETDHATYKLKYYCNTTGNLKNRSHLLIRFNVIHYFGEWLAQHGVLSHSKKVLNYYEYTSQVKLLPLRHSSGNDSYIEPNIWDWAHDKLSEEKSVKVLRPNCNNARIIVRKKVSGISGNPFLNTTSKVQQVWWALGNKGYSSDIVITPKRLIVDTNCFIQHLDCVKKLTKLFPYPVLLPVSVVLELKGLSKGGLRTRHREKFGKMDSPECRVKAIEGNETGLKCKAALEYIHANMKNFRVITTTGRVLPVKSVYERVQDDYYDPKQSNDDRILNTCRYVEMADKSLRKQDTPRRLFRNTVLLTGDRCLRIRTRTEDIPGRDIAAVAFWAWRYNIVPVAGSSSSSSTSSHKRFRRPNRKQRHR